MLLQSYPPRHTRRIGEEGLADVTLPRLSSFVEFHFFSRGLERRCLEVVIGLLLPHRLGRSCCSPVAVRVGFGFVFGYKNWFRVVGFGFGFVFVFGIVRLLGED